MFLDNKYFKLAAGIAEIPIRKDEKIAIKTAFLDKNMAFLKEFLKKILLTRPINKTIVHPIEINDEDKIIENILKRGEKIIFDFKEYSRRLLNGLDCKNHIKGFITYPGAVDYPELLSAVSNGPLILFCIGTPFNPKMPNVAVVGARRLSRNYFEKTLRLSGVIASHGAVIVSGLAYGADSAAHLGALEVKGRTIAVLGTAINNVYPASNRELKNRILKNEGTIVSEYPVNAQTEKYYFSERNRIISGLSHASIITRAALKSGSLITARYANEQCRKVFTFRGQENEPSSQGCEMLINKGKAIEIRSEKWLVNEFFEFFNSMNLDFNLDNRNNFIINKRNNKKNSLSLICASILENLRFDITVESLSDITGYTISQVGAAITELELMEYIKRDNKNNIIILASERKKNGKNSDNC